ncbi:acyltransferase [Nostoc sp. CHAB 5834]|nr:acyltransferase [Nostoc sp. CHAB 5834]
MKKEKILYLTGLNGLRAIAALSVLISHVVMPGIADFGLKHSFRLPLAEFGVTLFFVISGFLITYLLLLEKDKSPISVRNFYMRRILRIWPLYYGYIFAYLVLIVFSRSSNSELSSNFYWYLFFAANIPFVINEGILLLVHYWSIGVEEQFYIFWPWFVKISRGKLIVCSLILLMVILSSKLLFWYFLGKESVSYRFLSATRFHCMIVGAVGSIFYYQDKYLKFFNWKVLQLLSWAFFVLIGFGLIQIPATISHEFFSIISLILIAEQVSSSNKVISLELPVLNFIGKISYGIYVIHPMVILLISPVIKGLLLGDVLKNILAYSSVITITIGLAYLSYEYLEKPFLKYKDKFSVIKSSNLQINSVS